jgi:hypothetical protein
LTPPGTTANGLIEVANGTGADRRDLLSQSTEQVATGFGSAAVESKGELVQSIVQMRLPNRALVGARRPSLQPGDHTIDAGR